MTTRFTSLCLNSFHWRLTRLIFVVRKQVCTLYHSHIEDFILYLILLFLLFFFFFLRLTFDEMFQVLYFYSDLHYKHSKKLKRKQWKRTCRENNGTQNKRKRRMNTIAAFQALERPERFKRLEN